MGFVALFASKISDARGRGLILALDAIHQDIWDAIGSGTPVWGDPEEVTISGGIVTLTSGVYHYTIDTQGDDPTDDLDRINGLSAGMEILIRPEHADRSIVMKEGTYLKIGVDFTMNSVYDNMKLLNLGGNVWQQLSRASSGS